MFNIPTAQVCSLFSQCCSQCSSMAAGCPVASGSHHGIPGGAVVLGKRREGAVAEEEERTRRKVEGIRGSL